MFAIASLLLVVAVSLVVGRVATVLLVATGMSHESARFQARSALTGSGFTTSESEPVVEHPFRRRVIMGLMLMGSAGVVAGVSSLILGFRSAGAGPGWARVLLLGLGLLVLVSISRSAWVDLRLTAAIRWVLHRYTDVETKDLGGLLALSGGYVVTELAVRPEDWLAERSLEELALREEGAVVLGIIRSHGPYEGAPTAASTVHAGDRLVLYGRAELLRDLDERHVGSDGDREHRDAVARQHLAESA